MKVKTSETLPNGIGLSIVEVDNPIAVEHFQNRFQLVLVVKQKNILPKLKNKFRKFKSPPYIYSLKSDVTGENVQVNQILYHEKQICDRSWDDCVTELMEYISMYNREEDLKKQLKRVYKF